MTFSVAVIDIAIIPVSRKLNSRITLIANFQLFKIPSSAKFQTAEGERQHLYL